MDPTTAGGRFMSVAEDDIEDVSSGNEELRVKRGAGRGDEIDEVAAPNSSLSLSVVVRKRRLGEPPVIASTGVVKANKPQRKRKNCGSKVFGKAGIKANANAKVNAKTKTFMFEKLLVHKRNSGERLSERTLGNARGKGSTVDGLLRAAPLTVGGKRGDISETNNKHQMETPVAVISLVDSSDDDVEEGQGRKVNQSEAARRKAVAPSSSIITEPSSNSWMPGVLDEAIECDNGGGDSLTPSLSSNDEDDFVSPNPVATNNGNSSSYPVTWQCLTCTLETPMTSNVCEACDQRENDAEEGWTCGVCTLDNVQGVRACEVCGTFRPSNSFAWSSETAPVQKLTDVPGCNTPNQIRPQDIPKHESMQEQQLSNKRLALGDISDSDMDDDQDDDEALFSEPENEQQSKKGVKHKNSSSSSSNNVVPLSGPDECLEMWPERFKPLRATDLCPPLAPKKIEMVRRWLDDAMGGSRYRLLILHGPVGVGKSSCVEVLAKELGLNICTWKPESERATTANFNVERSARNSSGHDVGSGRGHSIYATSDMYVPYISQLEDFERFLRDARFPPLQFTGDVGTTSKNTASLLLIEALPNISSNDTNKRERLHRAIQSLVAPQRSQRHKMICVIIHSSGEETANPTEMRRLFSTAVIESPYATCVSMGNIPPTRMLKVLKGIATDAEVRIGDEELESLVNSTNGDLRNAILSLQFHALGVQPEVSKVSKMAAVSKQKKTKKKTNTMTSKFTRSRDANYSLNHAVAKLIRGNTVGEVHDALSASKKKKTTKPTEEDRAKLNYIPEQVADSCPLEPIGLLAFMQHNSPQHFVELEELSATLNTFCDADTLAKGGRLMDQGTWKFCSSGTMFPGAYVSSLSARAVPAHRSKRANLGFCTMNVPRVWEEERKAGAEKARLREALTASGQLLSASFHTDLVPLVMDNTTRASGQDARDDQQYRFAELVDDDIVDED